jgi:hypothetical protein
MRRRLDIDPRQLAAVHAFLSGLAPEDELAYRMALRGMFMRCRGTEWTARIDELRAELVRDTDDAARIAVLASEVRERIAAILAALKAQPKKPHPAARSKGAHGR